MMLEPPAGLGMDISGIGEVGWGTYDPPIFATRGDGTA